MVSAIRTHEHAGTASGVLYPELESEGNKERLTPTTPNKRNKPELIVIGGEFTSLFNNKCLFMVCSMLSVSITSIGPNEAACLRLDANPRPAAPELH